MRDSLADGRKMVSGRHPVGQSAQINSSRALIASSRMSCNQTKDMIDKTFETIKRSLDKLHSKPEADPWQLTDSDHR